MVNVVLYATFAAEAPATLQAPARPRARANVAARSGLSLFLRAWSHRRIALPRLAGLQRLTLTSQKITGRLTSKPTGRIGALPKIGGSSLRTDLHRPPAIAEAFDPNLALAPITTGRELRIGSGRRRPICGGRRPICGRWGRIIAWGRRRRRWTIGDSAADDGASRDATENSGADGAAVATRIRRGRCGRHSKAKGRSRGKCHERLVHVISSW